MGFTIGSGGGPPPDNSVSEDKIVDEAVSENKLSAAVVAQLGGGAEWQVATQASDGNALTLTLSPTGAMFEIEILILAGQNTILEVEFNNSAGGYSYSGMFGGSPVAGLSGAYLLPTTLVSGTIAEIKGTAYNFSEQTGINFSTGCPAGSANGLVYKTITSSTALTHIKITSSAGSGIGAGSFIKARKIS